ncbi:MAG: leucine-rich repeat domain-containing protein [Promethearchaeota archaeon]|nr:MAG: leucine-rich repeat domain-containing protein [Candidatus Lokiarchaeota archaeon]
MNNKRYSKRHSKRYYHHYELRKVDDINKIINIKPYCKEFFLRLLEHNIKPISCTLNKYKDIISLVLNSTQLNEQLFSNISLPYIKQLAIRDGSFNELTFLQEFKELTSLELSSCELTKIPNLSNLNYLGRLCLNNNDIEDINWFGNLERLKSLSLLGNNLTSLEGLANIKGCRNLRKLELQKNRINDLCGFESLTHFPYLEDVILKNNNISELNVWYNVPRLKYLDLSNNQIEKITALKNLPALKTINLSKNNITHLGNFENLPSLKDIYVKKNPIKSFSHLDNLPNLYSIEDIDWDKMTQAELDNAVNYLHRIALVPNFYECGIYGPFPVKRFLINEFFELRLNKYGKTEIYIKGKLYTDCSSLFLTIPSNQTHQLDNIESIDEAAELLGQTLDKAPVELHIDSETEFWGHCSNLQAWYEYDYDTRLLHHSLAFHLLRELTKAGDPLAKRVFKEEIASRYASGYPTVVEYLRNEGYLNYLTENELISLNK